jgi:hypothetical protein
MQIQELAERLEALREKQRDIIVRQDSIHFKDDGTVNVAHGNDEVTNLEVQDQAQGQFAEKLGVPKKYWDRMRGEAPTLLAKNANHWLPIADEKKGVENRLLRVMDSDDDNPDALRAFLSDRYRIIDHLDVLVTAVQSITGQIENEENFADGCRVMKCFLTRKNMDVTICNPGMLVDLNNLDGGIQQGTIQDAEGAHSFIYAWPATAFDKAQPYSFDEGMDRGFRPPEGTKYVFPTARIRNSETGHGGLTVQPGLLESICRNGMWIGQSMRQIHLGSRLDENSAAILRPETRALENRLVFMKLADTISTMFTPEGFLKLAQNFKSLDKVTISDLQRAMDNVVRLPGMKKEMRDDILSMYKRDYEARAEYDTAFDVQRAVSAAAREVEDPETRFAMEETAGLLIQKPALLKARN